MFCVKCGRECKDGAKFCMGCGAPLAPVVAPAPIEEITPVVEEPVVVEEDVAIDPFENNEISSFGELDTDPFEAEEPTMPFVVEISKEEIVEETTYVEPIGQVVPVVPVQPIVPNQPMVYNPPVPQQEPPKKKSKAPIIIGIVVAFVAIIGITVGVLFATGTFDFGDDKKTTEKADNTDKDSKDDKETTTEAEKSVDISKLYGTWENAQPFEKANGDVKIKFNYYFEYKLNADGTVDSTLDAEKTADAEIKAYKSYYGEDGFLVLLEQNGYDSEKELKDDLLLHYYQLSEKYEEEMKDIKWNFDGKNGYLNGAKFKYDSAIDTLVFEDGTLLTR